MTDHDPKLLDAPAPMAAVIPLRPRLDEAARAAGKRAEWRRSELASYATEMLALDTQPAESLWAFAHALDDEADGQHDTFRSDQLRRLAIALRQLAAIDACVVSLQASGCVDVTLGEHVVRNAAAADGWLDGFTAPSEGQVRASLYRALERHRPSMTTNERAAVACRAAGAFRECWS